MRCRKSCRPDRRPADSPVRMPWVAGDRHRLGSARPLQPRSCSSRAPRRMCAPFDPRRSAALTGGPPWQAARITSSNATENGLLVISPRSTFRKFDDHGAPLGRGSLVKLVPGKQRPRPGSGFQAASAFRRCRPLDPRRLPEADSVGVRKGWRLCENSAGEISRAIFCQLLVSIPPRTQELVGKQPLIGMILHRILARASFHTASVVSC